ncbi:hypothetical protein BN1723_018264, partial [Verticillium longisporum]
MQKLVGTGKVRNIGVSNFGIKNLERLLNDPSCKIVPAVNQIELHPCNPSPKLLEYNASKGIHSTAYSCLGSTDSPLYKNETLLNIAKAKGKTPQQVLLLWGLSRGTSVIPNRGEVKAVETKRGRERGNVEANDDMTIEDMVREERRTRGQAGGEGARLAERIAKDGKFDDDLEYLDENADKLAKRVHKSEINLKNVAVNEYQKLSRILDNCPLCYHEDKNQQPLAPVLSLGTRVYLTLATEPEVSPGGAVIAPLTHRKNLLECDDDEWEELRNFMK